MQVISHASIMALGAFQTKMDMASHNLANMQTENFSSYITDMEEIPSGGVRARVRRQGLMEQESPKQNQQEGVPNNDVDVAKELVTMIEAKIGYTANAKMIKAQASLGDFLDIWA